MGVGEFRLKSISRLGAYAANTIAVFAVGVLSVPAIIHFAGTAAWAGIAVTQAVAGLGAVVVAFGWNAMGPSTVATIEPQHRAVYYYRTLVARCALFVVTAPAAVVASILIAGIDPLAASLSTCAYLAQSLGASWYFVGEGRPGRLLLIDTAPRLLAVVAGMLALAVGMGLTGFTAFLLAGTVIAGSLGAWTILRGSRLTRGQLRRPHVGSLLLTQRHAIATTSSAAIYANMPLIAVSVIAPDSREGFALVFKLYNYAAAALAPLVQFLQSWVPGAGEANVGVRSRRATHIAYVGGACAFAAMLALGVPAGYVLSAGQLTPGLSLVLPFAVAIGAVTASQVVGLACLTALGRQSVVAASTAAGAFIGIVLIFVMTSLGGTLGTSWSIAVTEVFVTAYQCFYVRRAYLKRLAAQPNEESS